MTHTDQAITRHSIDDTTWMPGVESVWEMLADQREQMSRKDEAGHRQGTKPPKTPASEIE